MIKRYSHPQLSKIWEEEYKFKKWLEVEIAVCEGWQKQGVIPKSEVDKIKKNATFDIKRIEEIEKETKHDVVAFVKAVCETLGEEGKYIHYGVTSYDIVDTALSCLMKESAEIIISEIKLLNKEIKKLAKKYKYLPMMGRTHGIHAEPITFGFKLAVWYSEMQRNLSRMEFAKQMISYGKISGAVGNFANIPPQIEDYVCKKLKLKPADVSTQILQRDRHAQFITTLAIIASSLEKFATEIRNLQRTEIREVEEYFAQGQHGSSAMPHKRNPIVCEQISGLARVVRGYAIASLENISLWGERDLTNSAPERIIIPQSIILTGYLLLRFRNVLKNLRVYPENMKRNIKKSNNLFFSQQVMLKLIEKGLSRDEAYKIVQRNATTSHLKDIDFKELINQDREVRKYLSPDEIENCFDINYYFKNLSRVFNRLNI